MTSTVPGEEGGGRYGPFQNGQGQPPTSDPPAPEQPTYQAPASPQPQPAPPVDSWSLFPDGGPGSPSWQPRITPVPKPARGPVVRAALLGLLAGLLVFGPTGYLVGHQSTPAPAPPEKRSPATSTAQVLPLFEHTQRQLNTPKFPNELTPIANSWLPWITGCAKNGDKDGPRLGDGEDSRVACHYANATIFFVTYKSPDERDKAYTKFLAQNIDAKRLAPGVGEPTTKKTTSGTVNGRYVEFAYKTTNDATGKPVCGVWWSDANAPIAAYLLAYWSEGLGESWEPLRDVWRRYS
ncbi:hypothetical protein HC028_10305 [Planosporangium flavigriseum]|uniref:Uncharacterized protein n=1 Tax=Planosporangium flavigriseum TaxID=373681 RepID=A0A8J3LLG7_9ACTN|nr:hypothetical protein [Planosporangium flavigriseum]NJC64891.1 hypothetical protein [Planosporangium flavigriseum]GIG72763.1 hypothetical protein Pfl04_11670 [Planosporangium flavigriseum]